MSIKRLWAIVLMLALWTIAPTALARAGASPSAAPLDTQLGAQVFELHCAGCHANGGNIVRRGKTLKLKALEKNQVNTLSAIAELVAHGKGNMSAYQSRLTAAEIEAVSAYVLEQAQQNWKS